MYKVKIINNIGKTALEELGEGYEYGPDIEDPDAILVRSGDLHDYNFGEGLKFIGRAGVGVNNIPIERCTQLGIEVANAPGANANAVKELFIFALMASSRKILEGIDRAEGLVGKADIKKEVEAGKKAFKGGEVLGKKLLVIGLGHVGQEVCDAGLKMGMTVYGYDPFLSVDGALNLNSGVNFAKDLDQVLGQADYISLHIPYKKETEKFVDEDFLGRAKEGAVLINLARGELVDTQALEAYLKEGKLAKYVVDFPDEKTLTLPNTINIPHLGASTFEAEENSSRMVVRQLKAYLEGGKVENSINFPAVDLGPCRSLHRISLFHKNVPNMLGQITGIFARDGINIANLTNKYRGDYAYTLVDLDDEINEALKNDLKEVPEMVKVRLIK